LKQTDEERRKGLTIGRTGYVKKSPEREREIEKENRYGTSNSTGNISSHQKINCNISFHWNASKCNKGSVSNMATSRLKAIAVATSETSRFIFVIMHLKTIILLICLFRPFNTIIYYQ
jgi:hypothetical protein